MPAFPVLLAAHVVNLCALLALTTHHRWPFVAVGAVVPAWVAILQWHGRRDLATTWPELLAIVGDALRGVRRIPVCRRPSGARQSRPVSRGSARERHGVSSARARRSSPASSTG